jgi:tetrahydrodipicolinate N-succinyltransferase
MDECLLIVGGSSTALEIREYADSFYADKYDNVYNLIGDNELAGISNVVHDSELDDFISNKQISYIIGFANQRLRKIFDEKLSMFPKASIIHPTAVIAPSAKVGLGSYIGPFAVISSNACVGESCMINIGVSVGHDANVGNNCIINPGARISGHCKIGDRTLIGANSFIFQGLSVAEDCSIDAMTYLDQNLEESVICTKNTGVLKKYKNRFK